jgi:hypothetical protein
VVLNSESRACPFSFIDVVARKGKRKSAGYRIRVLSDANVNKKAPFGALDSFNV